MHENIFSLLAATVFAIALAVVDCPTATAQQVFNSPEAAIDALVAAAKANDETAIARIFGPRSGEVLGTVDKARDRELRARFAAAAGDYRVSKPNEDGSLTLTVGYQAWPLPIPLVKSGAGWVFDIDAGGNELINRRIGVNELQTIDTLRAYVEAQRAYASTPRDKSGVRSFARKLVSSEGGNDGLYWRVDATPGRAPSPFAEWMGEPGAGTAPMLRDGYRYQILTRQGASAPGGAYNYVINGRLLAGFALIAYPAEYGRTGVMTFVINHYGDIYEKNLGRDTAAKAAKITAYAPDATWSPVFD